MASADRANSDPNKGTGNYTANLFYHIIENGRVVVGNLEQVVYFRQSGTGWSLHCNRPVVKRIPLLESF